MQTEMDMRLGIVAQFREKISKMDSEIVWLLESRLKLVSQLQAFKSESSIPPVDRGREHYIIGAMQREYEAGGGEYLSPESIATLMMFILSLTKDELNIAYEPGLDPAGEIPF